MTLNDELIKNLSMARDGSLLQEVTTIVNDVLYYANSKIFSPKVHIVHEIINTKPISLSVYKTVCLLL